MNGIIYDNTKTTLPGWVNDVHEGNPKGYAYETETHFVHIYGCNNGIWVLSTGLTVTEKKSGTLNDWVIKTFGAENIESSNVKIGETTKRVWRPGLLDYSKMQVSLNNSEIELRDSMQSLRVLLNKLDELFLYIEPQGNGINSYSYKTRELLILACTEVENSWTNYFKFSGIQPSGRNYNTNDYVKLSEPLFLKEYKINLKVKSDIQSIIPFSNWNSQNPTTSLDWYDAYNKTKHDRETHFNKSTLENCIRAISANIVMFCVRFSPYPLWHSNDSTSAVFNNLFNIELINPNPKSFYFPKVNIPENSMNQLVCFDSQKLIERRNSINLTI
ncbi:hypothetical protein [Aquimarina agarivorans]|uniref:hypothetical protein n=1 Tax=Aquimarina agarivorans TaxID=980584 RepID=UPI000248ED03|nr:hypothetical protein [Aquimarina agarivorans]